MILIRKAQAIRHPRIAFLRPETEILEEPIDRAKIQKEWQDEKV